MKPVDDLLRRGLAYHRAGQLEAAAACYRQILAIDPQQADAWHLAGLVAHQQGRPAGAGEAIRRAIELAPSVAIYHANLSEILRVQGDLTGAVAHGREAIRLAPEPAGGYNNLGLALLADGLVDEAVAALRAGLERSPQSLELLINLGEACRVANLPSDAEAYLRQALHFEPRQAAAWLNLGNVLRNRRRLAEAARCLRKALAYRPGYAKAHANLCAVLLDAGELEEAGQEGAEAVRYDPQLAEAHANLSAVLHQQGRLAAALEHAQAALQLAPQLAEAHHAQASVLQERGQAPEAEHDFAATIATPTGIRRPDLHGNWLRSLQLVPGITPERLLAEHRAWDERHASPLRSNRPHPKRSAALGRPLRLGLVSPDLGQHPVGQFTISWLPHVDRGKVEVYCYSDRGAEDWLTADIRAAAAVFVDVREQSDDQLAARIEADEIDILCDLAGHTRLNRLLMFARRPAPVQLSWIGYPGTTGLSAMDGLIADRHVIPPEEEANYVERVLRLPHGWLCYSPPAGAPAIGPPPCVERGYVTFGCFNNTSKINAEVIALWSELLAQTPRSRLMLKFKWFDDPATCDHFADWFARHGIERWRLELRGWSDQHTHLAAYSEIDLALDTFPYTGGVTTCEALWMGVPVVSLVGRTFAERQSLSHLTNLGLAEWAAASKFAYVAQALGLARDPKRLAEWRGTLRERVANSPLCAGAAFARDLTALLLQAATNA